jgi:hypothetical protein
MSNINKQALHGQSIDGLLFGNDLKIVGTTSMLTTYALKFEQMICMLHR